MSADETRASEGAGARQPVPDLYAAMTEFVLRKNPHTLSIHRSLWGPGTATRRESLELANRTLVRGCRLDPGRHVLDAGCGVGGTAISLAERHGVRVTGLTNCAPHVAVAAQAAQERGVAHLVEFVHGDFMNLPFADASFDAVLNQESFCYANDKPAYLRGVFRVLKPGGRWQALDGELLNGAPASERHRALLAIVERDWRLPPIVAWFEVLAMLEQAGFTNIEEEDLSAEALPSSQEVRRDFRSISFLIPGVRETNPALQAFMDAAACTAEGLSEGLFTYRFLSGTKPT